jgi:DNA repair exonuclease SbcCD ATPase subunit
MKLTGVVIENFRWHREFSIGSIPWLLLITGPNASGKTSILEAITWAFCGATRHTSIDGKGADVLIMDGEGRACVHIDLEGDEGNPHVIKRSIPHSLSVDGVNGGVRRTTELLGAILAPISPQNLLLCFESTRIMRMNDQERKKFLASILGIGSSNTRIEVEEKLRVWLPTIGVPVDSQPGQAALRHFDTALVEEFDYQSLHKFFAEERKDLNLRAHKAISSQLQPLPAAEPGPSIEFLMRRKIMLEAEMELSKAKEIKPEDRTAAVLVKPDVGRIQSKLSNLQSILERTKSMAAPLETKIALMTSQTGQIGSAAKQCPFFMKVCPIPKEEVDAALGMHRDQLKSDHKALAGHHKRIDQTAGELVIAEKELQDAMAELEKYGTIWSSEQKVTLERIRPVAEIEKEMLVLSERMEQARQADTIAAIAAAHHALIADATEAVALLPMVETLVTAFAPSGIPTMILGSHLPHLEELATQASRMITRGRYEISFSTAEGELDVHVLSDGRKRPISTLSTSEEAWVSLVISHVINQYLGNKILLIDEASVLDEDMKEGLQDFLLSVRGNYSNVIVCATIPEREEFLPRLREQLGSNCSRIAIQRG